MQKKRLQQKKKKKKIKMLNKNKTKNKKIIIMTFRKYIRINQGKTHIKIILKIHIFTTKV